MNTPETKEQARRLFFQSRLTRAQIAAIIGVAPRTLFDWIREGDWKSARNTAANAPMFITEHYYNQLAAINTAIRNRQERPFPTKDEAEIMRKLSLTIKQLKTRHTVSETVEIFAVFSNYMRKHKPAHLEEMLNCMTNYLNTLKISAVQTPINTHNQEQEDRNDWQQYLAELSTQQDADEIYDTVSRYAQQMEQQKKDHLGTNWQKVAETGNTPNPVNPATINVST